jgi:formyltetrahydrofolate hydrolase
MAQYRVLIDANDEKGLVYKVSTIFFEKKLIEILAVCP